MKTTNAKELQKFKEMADDWWDPAGKFKPLHKFNPVRIQYIRDKIIKHFNLSPQAASPLNKIKILDVGCGGGLITEPFYHMGASIKGIDAVDKNIKIATLHAQKNNLQINYQTITIEELSKTKEKFDVVFALEIIEHVDNPDFFIKHCLKLVKKNGLFFGSTINRTMKSYILSIIAAEYIMKWLPEGTHNWKKFITPHEFMSFLEKDNLSKVMDVTGVEYSLIKDEFSLNSSDLRNNYMLYSIVN